jgi:glycosyltransferase involved in cell wall biosynthesis
MKALIVDPGLRSAGGHHLNAALRLKAELAGLQVATTCLASAYAEPAVVEAVGCTSCFTRSLYGRHYDSPAEFASGVEQMQRELAAATGPRGIAADLLVLPCADQMLALALARQLGRRRLRPPVHVVLWLLYPPHFRRPCDPEPLSAVETECREAFGQLVHAVGHARLRAFCETAALADEYRTLLSLDVGVMPGPGLVRAQPTRTPGRASRPPTIACLGYANRAKGYGLLPGAVASVLARHPDVRFAIHGISEGSDAEDRAALFDQLARLGPRVSVCRDALGREAYEDRLAEADFLLLPYDPAVYRARGSGIFSEAHRLGIPVIAPAACAFSRPALDAGWGVPIERYDAGGVAEAVLAALADRQGLAERARVAASQCQDQLPRLLEQAVRAAAGETRGMRWQWLRRVAGPIIDSAARYLPP